ncbi:hypothetical protein BLA29_008429 [Euroglyphus maynei]|uniref:AN1-type domain-containing protein n=1 Tax=Euroglyphus maynei TaxID=6958 RepID=A0A1Y3BNT6_EURMA|nr:hypothetical protein BLA29_008429 [Euroglyphus maynei]
MNQPQREQNDIRPLPSDMLRPSSRTTFRSSSYERSTITTKQENRSIQTMKKSHVSIKSIRMELDIIQNKINDFGKNPEDLEKSEVKKIDFHMSNDDDNNQNKKSQRKKDADNKNKNRCQICTRSIQIIGFDCRCGGRYCIEHRLAKEHFCQFDYRTYGINELTKANPKVVGDKIKKI